MAPVERVTLFKIPKEEDIDRLLEQYKILSKTAVKVSKAAAAAAAASSSNTCTRLTNEYRMASPISSA